MKFILVDHTDKEVLIGSKLTSFRNEIWILKALYPPHRIGSGGKISVICPTGDRERIFYPSVFELKFIQVEGEEK